MNTSPDLDDSSTFVHVYLEDSADMDTSPTLKMPSVYAYSSPLPFNQLVCPYFV
ncbi:hypothetical protein H310_14303 [Aphanomyces invadans]|uniref:Uncharacterized protein n=1 Tax=Aphanomyces invadans TaxID=157072 RepID=A0A024TAF0_9STRA|nr:hypothetical protein H310_14303 [Aphanomyces invadans]ETV90959.1 hypothetical protein H310_14303 [Aphanomyces invadans]|eukprot:XP_008880348.1 hypothetical protein H310_14303 [Aphanomyces invadans]